MDVFSHPDSIRYTGRSLYFEYTFKFAEASSEITLFLRPEGFQNLRREVRKADANIPDDLLQARNRCRKALKNA